jgi:hypothetical protein
MLSSNYQSIQFAKILPSRPVHLEEEYVLPRHHYQSNTFSRDGG